MNRLTVLRHAEASSAPVGGSDFDRPLSSQGITSARSLGALLASRIEIPARLRVSPSLRTRQTAELVCGAAFPDLAGQMVELLYLASLDVLIEEIASTPETCAHVMLVGHNPGLSELWALLGQEPASPRCRRENGARGTST